MRGMSCSNEEICSAAVVREGGGRCFSSGGAVGYCEKESDKMRREVVK